MQLLTERYNKKTQGVIACYDRVVIHGTLPGFNYAEGMTSFLKANNIRIEGSRIKHHMGTTAIKMYDKHRVLKQKDIHIKGSTFSIKKIWKYSRQLHEVSLILMVFKIKISENISCKKPAVKCPGY